MNQTENNLTILLPAIQGIVKLLNQPYEPALLVVKLLEYLAKQKYLQEPCLLLPNKLSGKLCIAYAAGFPLAENKRIEELINKDSEREKIVSNGELVSQILASKYIFAEYGIDFDSCVILEDVVGIPIRNSHANLGATFSIVINKEASNNLHSILNMLCISSVFIGQLLQLISLPGEKSYIENDQQGKKEAFDDDGNFVNYGIIGTSSLLHDALKTASRAAQSQASVMLLGESGTGKEKFARMIHNMSDRRLQPFIAINCAAIPENLLESELFGYEKGSFTGASQTRKGKFELATGGTLFLDEIGDMTLELQSKLLRVLQENVIQRIGGRNELPVNVRIITATHQNMQNAVNSNLFRLDLFYRLNVIKIKLPPLRDRKEDIGLLSKYFWNIQNEKRKGSILLTEEAIDSLKNYNWPGNIRQLENVLERAAIMSDGNIVTGKDIDKIVRDESYIDPVSNKNPNEYEINQNEKITYYKFGESNEDQPIVRPYYRVTDEEKEQIVQVLKSARGNKTYAAKKLGLTPRQLHYRMEKLKINI